MRKNKLHHSVVMKIIALGSRGTRMGPLRIARSITSILSDSKIGEILFGISTTLSMVIRSRVALLAVLRLLHTIHGSMILEMNDRLDLQQDQIVGK